MIHFAHICSFQCCLPNSVFAWQPSEMYKGLHRHKSQHFVKNGFLILYVGFKSKQMFKKMFGKNLNKCISIATFKRYFGTNT